MSVLTSRTLQYRDERGNDVPVILTIFEPIQDDNGAWRCIFDFDPPIKPQNVGGLGVDWVQAFTHSLEYARLYFETTRWSRTGHWQGMTHLGLPASSKELPAQDASSIPKLQATSEKLSVQATRKLGIPDENGGVREITLNLFAPFPTEGGSWKCAFSFDPIDGDSIRYGSGSDFIESFLTALAAARRIYNSMLPDGWTGSDDFLDCEDFPIKIEREFRRHKI